MFVASGDKGEASLPHSKGDITFLVKPCSQPLRVGVIGLGPIWRKRYKPIVLGDRQRFQVRVVCDQLRHLALAEARRLASEVADGPTDLLETPDLDAVLLLDSQWHRLWALEQACRFKKPVLCVPSLATDAERAEQLCAQLEQSGVPVLFARAARYTPATLRLRRLLGGGLGPARFCRVSLMQSPSTGTSVPPSSLNCQERTFEWIDWCLHLMQALPSSVSAMGVKDAAGSRFDGVWLEFCGGRAAQIQLITLAPQTTPANKGDQVRAEVIAEHGAASFRSPRVLHWSTLRRDCRERLPARPPERRLLRQFRRMVKSQTGNTNQLEEVRSAWQVLQAVERARAEQRSVNLEELE